MRLLLHCWIYGYLLSYLRHHLNMSQKISPPEPHVINHTSYTYFMRREPGGIWPVFLPHLRTQREGVRSENQKAAYTRYQISSTLVFNSTACRTAEIYFFLKNAHFMMFYHSAQSTDFRWLTVNTQEEQPRLEMKVFQ